MHARYYLLRDYLVIMLFKYIRYLVSSTNSVEVGSLCFDESLQSITRLHFILVEGPL